MTQRALLILLCSCAADVVPAPVEPPVHASFVDDDPSCPTAGILTTAACPWLDDGAPSDGARAFYTNNLVFAPDGVQNFGETRVDALPVWPWDQLDETVPTCEVNYSCETHPSLGRVERYIARLPSGAWLTMMRPLDRVATCNDEPGADPEALYTVPGTHGDPHALPAQPDIPIVASPGIGVSLEGFRGFIDDSIENEALTRGATVIHVETPVGTHPVEWTLATLVQAEQWHRNNFGRHRNYITGGSYGGGIARMAALYQPSVFRGAISTAALPDLRALLAWNEWLDRERRQRAGHYGTRDVASNPYDAMMLAHIRASMGLDESGMSLVSTDLGTDNFERLEVPLILLRGDDDLQQIGPAENLVNRAQAAGKTDLFEEHRVDYAAHSGIYLLARYNEDAQLFGRLRTMSVQNDGCALPDLSAAPREPTWPEPVASAGPSASNQLDSLWRVRRPGGGPEPDLLQPRWSAQVAEGLSGIAVRSVTGGIEVFGATARGDIVRLDVNIVSGDPAALDIAWRRRIRNEVGGGAVNLTGRGLIALHGRGSAALINPDTGRVVGEPVELRAHGGHWSSLEPVLVGDPPQYHTAVSDLGTVARIQVGNDGLTISTVLGDAGTTRHVPIPGRARALLTTAKGYLMRQNLTRGSFLGTSDYLGTIPKNVIPMLGGALVVMRGDAVLFDAALRPFLTITAQSVRDAFGVGNFSFGERIVVLEATPASIHLVAESQSRLHRLTIDPTNGDVVALGRSSAVPGGVSDVVLAQDAVDTWVHWVVSSHSGQLTFMNDALTQVITLGESWGSAYGLDEHEGRIIAAGDPGQAWWVDPLTGPQVEESWTNVGVGHRNGAIWDDNSIYGFNLGGDMSETHVAVIRGGRVFVFPRAEFASCISQAAACESGWYTRQLADAAGAYDAGSSVRWHDFDDDGLDDLLFATRGGRVHLWTGASTGDFAPTMPAVRVVDAEYLFPDDGVVPVDSSEDHGALARSIAVHGNHAYVGVGHRENAVGGQVLVFEVTEQRLICRRRLRLNQAVNGVHVIEPDGEPQLVVGASDGRLRVYSLGSEMGLRHRSVYLAPMAAAYGGLVYDPSTRVLVVASAGGFFAFDWVE